VNDKRLSIGMVCPYGWDTPGGVQIHIKELAEHLVALGHSVSVLAPVSDESVVAEPWLVPAGRPIPIPYNGAVARILFGPLASSRVKQWISSHSFDLLHVHEPVIPSLSLLASWAADGPVVATFHAAANKQKAVYAVGPILEPVIEKLTAKIAVSEMARATLKDHFDTEAIVIPNGVDTSKFHGDSHKLEWKLPNTIGFIGRFDEPRKGLDILLQAMTSIVKEIPDVRLLIAGPGDEDSLSKKIPAELRSHITLLGRLSEEDKVKFFHSITLYVAPNTGGESFGIILAEAMSAGTPIVASDIQAFKDLLQDGDSGEIFLSENSTDLSSKIVNLLRDEVKRRDIADRGLVRASDFDWQKVASDIVDVYQMALVGNEGIRLSSESRVWNRWRGENN
jgi:phosphatidyl-myo-inositol alpha-mannosyltransferase